MNKNTCADSTHRYRVSRSRGFTLLELMVTVTVMAVILTIGVPGFVSFVQNNRAATYTNELVTALNLGRSEAARRSTDVLVCSSTDGATCSGGADWSRGWVVRTAGGELLRSWSEPTGQADVISGGGAGSSQVAFQPRGTAAAAVTLRVRLPSCTGNEGRDVSVNRAGRVTVLRASC